MQHLHNLARSLAAATAVAACAGAPPVTTTPTTIDGPPADVAIATPDSGATPRASSDTGSAAPIAETPTPGAPDAAPVTTASASSGALETPASGSATAASNGLNTGAGAKPIPCKSEDDCWIRGGTTAATPIARPARLRGKKFRPCVDGEAKPICSGGFCGTMAFGC